MNAIEVWYNPRCSKCRQTKEILDQAGAEYSLFHYLEEPFDAARVAAVMHKLGLEDPAGMMRPKEAAWAELGLDRADAEARIAAMVAHPGLVERPIAIQGDRAVIARPPENIRDLL